VVLPDLPSIDTVNVTPCFVHSTLCASRILCSDIVGKCGQTQLNQGRCLIAIIKKTTYFGTGPSSGFLLQYLGTFLGFFFLLLFLLLCCIVHLEELVYFLFVFFFERLIPTLFFDFRLGIST
jgi:hypothetical protein